MPSFHFSLNARIASILSFVALFTLMPSVSLAQQEPQCKIEISSPRPGTPVGGDYLIKGSAQVPAGTYLWVFVHVRGLALWWPQGGGPVVVEKNGKWEALAFFGIERDAGKDFEIAVAALDSEANIDLLKWYKRTEDTGQYPGMRFPSVIKGCPIERMTVTKMK
jgi:hypothetical protein